MSDFSSCINGNKPNTSTDFYVNNIYAKSNVYSNGKSIGFDPNILKGDVNFYNNSDESKVSTITENSDGDLTIYNNNKGKVCIKNVSMIELEGKTHVNELYFNNVLTTNYTVINSDGALTDNLLINTAPNGQVLINSNQVQVCISGNTLSRPLSPIPPNGFMYFDTDLGIPIWWNDIRYVNALGTGV